MKRFLVALGLVAAAQTILAAEPTNTHVSFGDLRAQSAVTRAVQGATERLARPECQRLLTDFSDTNGRTLLENLDVMKVSAAEYLSRVWFLDGSREQPCRESISAFTRPGSRSVYICAEFMTRRPGIGMSPEVVIIHEMLHSLGLGEGGAHPSSFAITRQVEARCGR